MSLAPEKIAPFETTDMELVLGQIRSYAIDKKLSPLDVKTLFEIGMATRQIWDERVQGDKGHAAEVAAAFN